MLNCLFIGFGGFVGAICRYFVGMLPINGCGFPFTTLLINFIGTLFIGAFSQLPLYLNNIHPQFMLFLTVGLCGGFTTFSTFSLETIRLFETGKIGWGLAYIALSIIICLVAILIGRAITKAIF